MPTNWTIVQTATHFAQNITSGPTQGVPMTATFANPIGNGNMAMILAGFYPAGNTCSSFTATDNQGNSYVNRSGITAQANSYVQSVFYLTNIQNAPTVININCVVPGHDGTAFGIGVVHCAEITPSGVFDQYTGNHQTANATGTATAAVTNTQFNGEFIWAALSDSAFGGPSAGTGFTLLTVDTNNFSATEYTTQVNGGNITPTFTRGGSGGDDWVFVLTFYTPIPVTGPPTQTTVSNIIRLRPAGFEPL